MSQITGLLIIALFSILHLITWSNKGVIIWSMDHRRYSTWKTIFDGGKSCLHPGSASENWIKRDRATGQVTQLVRCLGLGTQLGPSPSLPLILKKKAMFSFEIILMTMKMLNYDVRHIWWQTKRKHFWWENIEWWQW